MSELPPGILYSQVTLDLASFVCLVTHYMGQATVPPKSIFDYVMPLIEYQMLHDCLCGNRTQFSHSRYITNNVPKKCFH